MVGGEGEWYGEVKMECGLIHRASQTLWMRAPILKLFITISSSRFP